MKSTVTWPLAILALTAGCGHEVGRVSLLPGGGASQVSLRAGAVALWTHVDLEHQGPLRLSYEVDVLRGEAVIVTTRCIDVLSCPRVKLGWLKSSWGGRTSVKGQALLDCALPDLGPGPVTVVARWQADGATGPLEARSLDLVLKQ